MLYDRLMEDYRFKEGLNACINCGTCTAICPAAEFYKYDPRIITDTVQSKDQKTRKRLRNFSGVKQYGIADNVCPALRDAPERMPGSLFRH